MLEIYLITERNTASKCVYVIY